MRVARDEENLAYGWIVLRNNSLYAERLPDWDTARKRFGSLTGLVESIHDDYSYFRDRDQAKQFESKLQQSNVVEHKISDDDVGIISVHSFASEHCADEVAQALTSLSGAREYVIDLRGNHGGLVDQAFRVYAMCVDRGEFAKFVGRVNGKNYREEWIVTRTALKRSFDGLVQCEKRPRNLTKSKPITVLVDADTRSAAEILAGALRDNGRCTIYGARTFGKGVVQETWTTPDGGSLRITVGRAFLSKSGCFDGLGIVPDVTEAY